MNSVQRKAKLTRTNRDKQWEEGSLACVFEISLIIILFHSNIENNSGKSQNIFEGKLPCNNNHVKLSRTR